MKHLICDICVGAICQFCDKEITNELGVQFGSERLHKACHNLLGMDLDDAFPVEDPVEIAVVEGDLEYAYQSFYGFGPAPQIREGRGQ